MGPLGYEVETTERVEYAVQDEWGCACGCLTVLTPMVGLLYTISTPTSKPEGAWLWVLGLLLAMILSVPITRLIRPRPHRSRLEWIEWTPRIRVGSGEPMTATLRVKGGSCGARVRCRWIVRCKRLPPDGPDVLLWERTQDSEALAVPPLDTALTTLRMELPERAD